MGLTSQEVEAFYNSGPIDLDRIFVDSLYASPLDTICILFLKLKDKKIDQFLLCCEHLKKYDFMLFNLFIFKCLEDNNSNINYFIKSDLLKKHVISFIKRELRGGNILINKYALRYKDELGIDSVTFQGFKKFRKSNYKKRNLKELSIYCDIFEHNIKYARYITGKDPKIFNSRCKQNSIVITDNPSVNRKDLTFIKINTNKRYRYDEEHNIIYSYTKFFREKLSEGIVMKYANPISVMELEFKEIRNLREYFRVYLSSRFVTPIPIFRKL